jgi:wyosine [tRNA(Phe)-imidazoG37] synthetase (radical SAM superfamily)
LKKPQNRNKNSYIYGPVPSRRLGYSLGVDILPRKTCTLSCIYCQLGPSRKKSPRRKNFYPQEDILREIRAAVESEQQIDHITFSGSGEPTLNKALGSLIREIKKITKIPVAVLTNSTLLSIKSVREALKAADLVVPSLDAATQDIFEKINRPLSALKLNKVIRGLKLFRKDYSGKIWLEIMLVKGINDSPSQVEKFKSIIAEIKPDKVQLNTVVRPPAETCAKPLSREELEMIRKTIGNGAEIIAEFSQGPQVHSTLKIAEKIYDTAKRRPVTVRDLTDSLGYPREKIFSAIKEMLSQSKLKKTVHNGITYYEAAGQGHE